MAEEAETQNTHSAGPTGWAALDDAVRERDERIVKDYKDDIDTLLVFAGLYSAVLTAFLIESYKNLQEDPQQVMINILWQISSQTNNYTVTPAAERVNVCWFASLVLSLSTASFGILVKQWLREYLAIDNSKPEERLRIRHHRYLGLKSWKLFEIAAFLSLILQLSLVLFFIGLCFLTASVHHSIGITSVVLVSGWALFFTFALHAPVLSSRCPYKTTFLKTLLRVARLYALPAIVYALWLIAITIVWVCLRLWYTPGPLAVKTRDVTRCVTSRLKPSRPTTTVSYEACAVQQTTVAITLSFKIPRRRIIIALEVSVVVFVPMPHRPRLQLAYRRHSVVFPPIDILLHKG